jgi:ABC-type Mn2+/Zn2+ transport system ATPase subunit
VQLAGKFTFPASVALENNEKDELGNLVAAENISIIHMKNVRFSYNVEKGHFIFNDPISFNVTATTRVGIMGPNGAGKSTFLKLLTHKLKPTSGDVIHHPNYTLAYFGQHSTAELDLELTPTEFMAREFPEERIGQLKNHLGKTGVLGDVQSTRMLNLSYSQRSCVIFSKLTYVCPHLLIMDEPTNFLDLESVDSLITACNKYKGALLLVSHNRDFLKKCARQYLSIVPGKFALFDDMQTAERSTYTFIAEMESGGKVGADALANNPGGGTVHPSQKTGEEEKKDGVITAKPAAKAAAPAPAKVTYALNETVLALWQDGKYYSAVVKKILPDAKGYQVLYSDYGNLANVPPSNLKKAEAAPAKGAAGAAPAKGAAAAAKKPAAAKAK